MEQQTEQKFASWAEGKPFAVTELARLAVESIGPLREFMECRRTSAGPFALELAVDKPVWLKFCRRKTMVRSFCELFFGPEVGPFIYRAYLALENPTAASHTELYCAWAMILVAFSECLPCSENNHITSSPAEGTEDEGLSDELMELPIVQFFLRTAIPCWFVYGVLPHQLLWNVCGDDHDLAELSVERLVRLDPKLVHHPVIQRWIKSDHNLMKFRAAKVQEWQRRRTPFDKPKKDSHWLRVVFGLLSSISELFDHRLLEPDLRKLAEILHCEIPEDMLEYIREKVNEDMAKEIRRYRPLFLVPPKPDRSAFLFVREVLKVVA
jgi:hypothetical protein